MYSKGISWIDDCRIPFVDETILLKGYEGDKWATGEIKKSRVEDKINTQGRFPANILVSDDMLNDGIKPNKGHRAKSKVTGYGEFGGGKNEYHGIGEYMEVDSKSRYYDIDKWFENLIK
jgi:outer membrane protein assembly factor BamA